MAFFRFSSNNTTYKYVSNKIFQRVLLNEALEIWLNVTNHSEVHSTTNSILTTINQLKDLNGLAVFTLLTNTKCKLLAQ